MLTQSPSPPVRIIGIVAAVLSGLCWAAAIGPLVFIVPKFEQIFSRFEVALPVATQTVLGLSHVASQFGLVLAALVLVASVGLAVLCGRARSNWPVIVAAVACGLSVVGFFVFQAVLTVSLFLPLVKLIEAVGRPH
jgi:type II secretory pathway component PulF